MDITKRFNRILQLFFILQSKSIVTIEELERRFEISKRTIYRDLKELESAGVPVIYEPGRGYGIMEGYRLQPSQFTQEEILSLIIAEKIMQQHETEFIKKNFESALTKIKGSLQLRQKDTLGELDDKLHVNNSTSQYLPDVINVLLDSTLSKLITEISYVKSDDIHPETRTIEPIGLFYESVFWYVLAFCHVRQDYRNFRLDRIKCIRLTNDAFVRKHLPIEKLRNLSSPQANTKIVIRAGRELSHYLFWERQNFGFTSEEISGEYVVMHFECTVHPTSFVRWFMKFVDFGEIVSPKNLKEELNEILLAGLTRINNQL